MDQSYTQLFVAAVVLVTVVLWVSERISVPVVTIFSVLILVLGGALSAASALDVLRDPVLQLLLGSLIIAKGLSVCGLAQRFATTLLSLPSATKNMARLMAAFAFISTALSLFLSNTAVTAMLLPVTLTIVDALKLRKRAEATGLLLMLTWGSSVAVGVIIGSPPNLIAQSALNQAGVVEIGFINWMAFAMPINVLMIIAAWVLLTFMYAKQPFADISLVHAELPPEPGKSLKAVEKICGAIFILTVLLWLLPDVVSISFGNYYPEVKKFAALLSPSNAALFGSLLLLIIPASSSSGFRPVLSPRQALSIDWRTMFLFGGGLVLGRAAFESGLAASLGRFLMEASGASSQLAVTAIMIALAIVLSELTSNTAAASLLVPLSLALASEVGVSPIPSVLGTAMGTSFGFMMPISTPPNSIVYSSGQVSMKEMFRAGIIFDCIGFAITLFSLWTILPLLGWW